MDTATISRGSTTTSFRDERFLRYSGIISPTKLINASILIVGVGAIGRQVALQLAAMGVGHITLVDHDRVERLNMGSQGYRPDQIGETKVEATKQDLLAINPACDVDTSDQKLTSNPDGIASYDCVFCCVDCMDARKTILNPDNGPRPAHAVDTRMSAFVVQSFYINADNRDEYAKTLFKNEDAHQEPCTARSTIFTSSIAAGLAITQWAQSLTARPALPFAQLLLDSWVLDPVEVSQTESGQEEPPSEDAAQQSPPSEP